MGSVYQRIDLFDYDFFEVGVFSELSVNAVFRLVFLFEGQVFEVLRKLNLDLRVLLARVVIEKAAKDTMVLQVLQTLLDVLL